MQNHNSKSQRLFAKFSLIDISAFLFFIAFTIAGILVSLHRYWQYEVSHMDFGYFDRAIWLVSRFQPPVVDHFVLGKINVFADRVSPSIFLLSPLYWFTDRSEMLLIVQALAVGISGLFLYDIAKTILKNNLLSFSILTSYFLFVGLQNAVITEFHELTVMTLPFMLTIWSIVKNKKVLFYIFLILTLGFKEITFALGIGLGIALLLLKKEWRKTGIITLLISFIWAFIAFILIIPYFSHGKYLYTNSIPDGFFEKIQALLDEPEKRRTLFYSFSSFSFLPIFAPQFWFMILQDYAARFIPNNYVTRWGLGMHYNAQSAVILAISSIFGIKYILRFSLIKKYYMILSFFLIIASLFLFRFLLHGPFLLAINPAFYRQTYEFNFLNEMIKRIPKDASVMTQSNLATRFTHQNIRLLTSDYVSVKPDYILMDLREGQNPNNYFGSGDFHAISEQLSRDKNYKVIYQTKDQFIYKRLFEK